MFYTTKEYPGTPVVHHHTDATYAIISGEAPRYNLADDESDETALFTLQELIDYQGDDMVAIYREMAIEILDYYIKTWEPVPFDEFDVTQDAL